MKTNKDFTFLSMLQDLQQQLLTKEGKKLFITQQCEDLYDSIDYGEYMQNRLETVLTQAEKSEVDFAQTMCSLNPLLVDVMSTLDDMVEFINAVLDSSERKIDL